MKIKNTKFSGFSDWSPVFLRCSHTACAVGRTSLDFGNLLLRFYSPSLSHHLEGRRMVASFVASTTQRNAADCEQGEHVSFTEFYFLLTMSRTLLFWRKAWTWRRYSSSLFPLHLPLLYPTYFIQPWSEPLLFPCITAFSTWHWRGR